MRFENHSVSDEVTSLSEGASNLIQEKAAAKDNKNEKEE